MVYETPNVKPVMFIGRLIPAGTGFPGSKKHKLIEQMENEFAAQAPAEVPARERETERT